MLSKNGQNNINFERNEQTENVIIDTELYSLDTQLMDFLKYWLPIGSKNEYCLKLSLMHELLYCTILLLVAKKRKEYAFEILYKSICKETNTEKICKFIISN